MGAAARERLTRRGDDMAAPRAIGRLCDALAGCAAALRVRPALTAIALAVSFAPAAAAAPASWRIEGKNGGEVTLLGSMHVLRASDYPLPPLVDSLYERADVLVLELDLDDPAILADRSSMLRAATLPPGKLLRDVLDAKLYGLAAAQARAIGFDLSLLEHLEPWLVAITLLDVGLQRAGFEAQRGLEQYLVRKATAAHKEIVGLESLEKQISVFDELPAAEQQALLEQTLEELDGANEQMNELAAAWRDGRIDELTASLASDFDGFPELYAALVTERNAEWTGQLEKMLRAGKKYLVVVGALHLVGRDSVIDRLEARGHRVEPIEQPD
jgi:uncharacterized protein YbaP (TraB family)